MIRFLFGASRKAINPKLASHARRSEHWAKVHIAADRRDPFAHLQPRKLDLVIGCRCGGDR